ncbi:MAG: phosphoglucomutase/phosphomannomutase family protein, partial [Blastocatellia bacterium]|nr:phosphoglucomutase/phosphomannomutase family protein [Blastocatellia bacterium]
PQFAGFRIKLPFGCSAPPSYTNQVEARLGKNPVQKVPLKTALADGRVEYVPISAAYVERLKEVVNIGHLKDQNLEVLVDSMFGTGGFYVENILHGGNLKVSTMHGHRDVYFGGLHPEPMMPQLQPLCDEVVSRGAFLGLSTDGDADRVGAVDDLGRYINTHKMLAILTLYLVRKRGLTGGVVRTISQSVMVKRIAESYGLPLYEVPVGFKHVAELMLKEDILCGGEESNGLGCKLHIPERDGIFNCLFFLEAVLAFGKKPSELIADIQAEFGAFEYERIDVKVDRIEQAHNILALLKKSPPKELGPYPVTEVKLLDGVKMILEDESWLLFRGSGTEPMLRVYSEATSREKMEELLSIGDKFVKDNLS